MHGEVAVAGTVKTVSLPAAVHEVCFAHTDKTAPSASILAQTGGLFGSTITMMQHTIISLMPWSQHISRSRAVVSACGPKTVLQ